MTQAQKFNEDHALHNINTINISKIADKSNDTSILANIKAIYINARIYKFDT
jgi:hypothetical protein